MVTKEVKMVHCTNCGETRTFASDDKRLEAKMCRTCLQGEMKPVVAVIDPADMVIMLGTPIA